MIYLDYAANHPVDPAVLSRFCAVEMDYPGNPNSSHLAGQAARELLAETTEHIASLLGAKPTEVLYTSGATEANNLALKGIARANRHLGKHILSTQLEHASVGGSLTALQQQGYEIDLLDIRRDGTIDTDQLRELLRSDTILLAVTVVDRARDDPALGGDQRDLEGLSQLPPACRCDASCGPYPDHVPGL